MEFFRRLGKFVAMAPFAAAFLAVAAYGVNGFLDERAGRAWEKIEMGATEASVVALMGKPDRERPCGKWLWWDYTYIGENDGRCFAEVRHEYFLSVWAVGYSQDRRVVSRFRYVSE